MQEQIKEISEMTDAELTDRIKQNATTSKALFEELLKRTRGSKNDVSIR